MDEQKLKQLKSHKLIVNLVSFLLVIALTIVLTANITMAAFGDKGNDNSGMLFGAIIVDDVQQNFIIRDSYGAILNKVTPGSDAKAHFNVLNTGTADMQVRFRVELIDLATENKVDTSIFDISIDTVTNEAYQTSPEYVLYDFNTNQVIAGGVANSQADVWFVRRLPLVGNLDTITFGPNDPPDEFVVNVHFVGEEMTNAYKAANIRIYVYVETAQAANNGTQRDPAQPGYDVSWSN